MGAGCSKDHYEQDAGEVYIVYKLQELAVKNNVALTNDVAEKKKSFVDYCKQRDITKSFDNSVYKHNIDAILPQFFSDIKKKFSGKKFDFIDVEKDFRDEKLKGDFIISFKDKSYISFSLKNYKSGFKQIQLCSGTWNSFVNNFLFESAGVGNFIDPFTGETFKGSNREKRNELVKNLGYEPLLEVYNFFDEVIDYTKDTYVRSEKARFWNNISSQWEKDCRTFGIKAINKIVEGLDNLSADIVKERIVHMAGLNYNEELLLVGKGKYLCSLTNEKYGELLDRVKNCTVTYKTVKKNVLFTLSDENGTIININVPFTLQKNGAWNLPSKKYSGKMYHAKEKMDLAYGERRPKKSKEIATSINTYLDLGKAGVC